MSIAPSVQQRRVRVLLLEQRALVASLLELREQLHGSLFTRFGVCGKPGCACARGVRHGPYHVLSTRRGGQAAFTYLQRGQVGDARRKVAGYRRFRHGMTRLRTLNRRLVAALQGYQRAVVRKQPDFKPSTDRIGSKR
jgi:hypothetical protein